MKRIALFVLLAACDHVPDPGGPDLLSRADAAPPDARRPPLAVVASSDFTSGALSTLDLVGRTVNKGLDTIDAQPVVRVLGGKVYVLDQTHGVVRTYDPDKGWKNPTEFSVGNNDVPAGQANPHDIYVDAATQRAYLTLYGSFGSSKVDGAHALAVVDLKTPAAGIQSFIPLDASVWDSDKNPDADRLFACGGTLYVTLQDLDRNAGYKPAGPARLAAISLAKPDSARYIQLAGQNPIAVAVAADCSSVLIGQGDFQFDDLPNGKGGIEQVDLVSQKSLGLLFTDTSLGGHVSALSATDASHAFVDVQSKSGMDYQNNEYALDVTGQKKGALVLGPMAFVAGIRVYEGLLLVLSAGTPKAGQLMTGVYLGPADGQPLATQPLDVGLPPVSMDVLP